MTRLDDAWSVIAAVRDRYPRRADDAPTTEIVDALVAAGLIDGEVTHDMIDAAGDLWTEVSPGRWNCRYGVTARLDWDTGYISPGTPWDAVVRAFGPMTPAREDD